MPEEKNEAKGLALLRILQILQKYSDAEHPMTQAEIMHHLKADYGIVVERRSVSRKIALLKEALKDDGKYVESNGKGTYLDARLFEDAELKLLIDGVLSSRYINSTHTNDLVGKLSSLSRNDLRAEFKNIYSVKDLNKSENMQLFYSIELVNDAISQSKQLSFDFNYYWHDKKLHFSSKHTVSPYLLVLHSQQYYLMAHDEAIGDVTYYRLDHITNMAVVDLPATDIHTLTGYEKGIDYKYFTAQPFMFSGKKEWVEFVAHRMLADQIIAAFGFDVKFTELENKKVKVTLQASLQGMRHWAKMFATEIEIIHPESLREEVKNDLALALEKYGG